MAKKIAILFIVWINLFIHPAMGRADIIPKDMKSVRVSLVLENMKAFPDHVFIQCEKLGDEVRKRHVLMSGEEIVRDYKFNQLYVTALPKSALEQGELIDLDLSKKNPETYHLPMDIIPASHLMLPSYSSISEKRLVYAIQALEKGRIQTTFIREDLIRNDPFPFKAMVNAFFATLLIEMGVFFIVTKFLFHRFPGIIKGGSVVLLAQVLTLPPLWYVLHCHGMAGPGLILSGEIVVIVVEALAYRFLTSLGWRQSFGLSLVCNTLSYGLGILS